MSRTGPSRVIDRSTVDLWVGSLRGPFEALHEMRSLLSPDELVRASRFHNRRDCTRFVVGRAYLRSLLAGYTGVCARDIMFAYGPQGKPCLSLPEPAPDVRFSLSHAPDMIAYAFTLGHDVGIDIESLDQPVGYSDEYSRYMTREESVRIQTAPPGEREELFLTYWTRKEACLKAVGRGFALNPQDVEVSAGLTVSLRDLPSNGKGQASIVLSVADIEIDRTYVCAVALVGNPAGRIALQRRLEAGEIGVVGNADFERTENSTSVPLGGRLPALDGCR